MSQSQLTQFLSRINRDPRIGSMCLGFVACLIMAPWLFFAWSDARFIIDGVRTEGRIVSSASVVETKFHTCYSYRFEYTDGSGRQHTGSTIRRAAELETGDVIQVRYLKSRPATAKSNDKIGNLWPTWTLAGIVVTVFLGSAWSGISGIRGLFARPT